MVVQRRMILWSVILSCVPNERGESNGGLFLEYADGSSHEDEFELRRDERRDYANPTNYGAMNKEACYEGEFVNRRDFIRPEKGSGDCELKIKRFASRNNVKGKPQVRKRQLQKREDPQLLPRSPRSPLILTPYLESNRRGEGIKASKVKKLVHRVKSYSGFFEVDEKKKSYSFFWFFTALESRHTRDSKAHATPVIVWLHGGLGKSSLCGALRWNGPIRLENNGTLTFNKYSWANKAHLVYFDSLVGAGYSYTKKGRFSKTQEEVATNLYSTLKQFLTLFHLSQNPLFIAGQSYAGKCVTALGVKIHKEMNNFRINLKGVVIGNGFIDPPNMLRYGAYMYQLGFIDSKRMEEFARIKTSIESLLKENKEDEAREKYVDWIQGDIQKKSPPLIERIMGPGMTDNYAHVGREVDEAELLKKFLNDQQVKQKLNVGRTPYMNENMRARRAIWGDLLKSQVANLQLLLRNYRVLLYQGQMSIKYSYPLVINYLMKMKWRGRKHFFNIVRNKWIVDGAVVGFFKTVGRLTELTVRDAGRNVPVDQPKWAQRMIEDFVYSRHFTTVMPD